MSFAAFRTDKATSLWAALAIAILLAGQFTLIFTRAINWDEFFWYSEVIAFSRGEITGGLQTFHTRIFDFLIGSDINSVEHIVAARKVMFLFECMTLLMIALLARRYSNLTTGLIAALTYLSAGFVIQHGFSYRVDPLITALVMSSLVLLSSDRLSWPKIFLFGLLVGLAGMVSVKAGLMLPAFAGLAWERWARSGYGRSVLVKLVACGLSSIASFLLLYFVHSYGLLTESAAVVSHGQQDAEAGHLLQSSAAMMFFIGIPPYWRMAVRAAQLAPIFAACLAATPFLLSRWDRPGAVKVAVVALLSQILLILFYHNTSAYFYVFLLAPLAIAVVPALDRFCERFPPTLLVGTLFLFGGMMIIHDDREVIGRQRLVVEFANEIFPTPVGYFDHNGMLSHFHKRNQLMTPWGIAQYTAANVPQYRMTMEASVVPLLLENDDLLTAIMENGQGAGILLDADARALRDNYIRYWGPIWIAGRNLEPRETVETEFLVPGSYLVENGEVLVDGVAYGAGAVVSLGREVYSLSNPGSRPVTLRWAEAKPRPAAPPPEGRLFIGF